MRRLLNKVLEARYKSKTTLHVALDVGTEWVKADVFKITPDGRGRILGTGKVRQKLSDMKNGAISDIGGVVENCYKALEAAEKQANGLADDCILGIAGELVKGETTRVAHQRHDPNEKMTMQELESIIEKAERTAIAKITEKIRTESGQDEIEVKLVNSSIVKVVIDGQDITNPVGFQGRNVEVALFNAFAPLVNLGALETVAEELGLEIITVAAEPYALARSISDSQDFSAIFIDAGGGTTDVAVVESGGIIGTKMYAFGGRTFTKRLGKLLGESFTAAEEVKLRYSAGGLDEATYAKCRELFAEDIKIWLAGLELALREFNVDLLPDKILLAGGASKLPEVMEALDSEWYKELPFAKKPGIRFLKPSDIAAIDDHTGTLGDPQDMTALALAKLAVEIKAAEEGNPIKEALKRVIKAVEA